MKNKLTVTRGVGGGGEEMKKAKGSQGTHIKDPWTKTMGGIECGRWGWVGWGRVMGGKWGGN